MKEYRQEHNFLEYVKYYIVNLQASIASGWGGIRLSGDATCYVSMDRV
jgi:hypothetical protein